MRGWRTPIYLLASLIVVVLLGGGLWFGSQMLKVREIFAANETLKEEGYYLAPFEFEMLSISYYLDTGAYRKGLTALNRVHTEMTDRGGLVKVPVFETPDEELAFYRRLQNPLTGAFYPNDTDPPVAFIGVTANMINLIERLSLEADRPFSLLYPLNFLESIATPETLEAMLDDVSRVGWVGRLIKPAFVSAIELQDLIEQDERLGFYGFSEDWKHAFYQWFYDNQDPETGLWGPRDRYTGAMLGGGDIGDSGKIIKMFVDTNGNNIHADMPLRYTDRIFASAISRLSTPIPEAPDRLHRWILDQDRGFRFLTKYVWKNATPAQKDTVADLLEHFVTTRFSLYYLPKDGAFSLYPHAEHPDLDGTSEAAGMLDYTGALSPSRQAALWGSPETTITRLERRTVAALDVEALAPIADRPDIISLRVYAEEPTANFTADVMAIYYPRQPLVRDTVELVQHLRHWLEKTEQTMGNWGTRDGIMERLSAIDIPLSTPTYGPGNFAALNATLEENRQLVAIGFDTLQVPRYLATFEKAGAGTQKP